MTGGEGSTSGAPGPPPKPVAKDPSIVECPSTNSRFDGIIERMGRDKYFKKYIMQCVNEKTGTKFTKESIFKITNFWIQF